MAARLSAGVSLVMLGLVMLGLGSFKPNHAAHAQAPMVIERTVAIVNDTPILLSELRRRAAPFLQQALSAPSEAERMSRIESLYAQVLDQLVDEALIDEQARALSLVISNEEIDRAIENVKRQSGLPEDEFWNAVQAQGFSPTQYREDVRRQMVRMRVLQNRVAGRVNITESDVKRRFRQTVGDTEVTSRTCYDVATRMFAVEEGADGSEAIAQARSFRGDLGGDASNADFEGDGTLDLGEVCEGDLQPQLAEVLQQMDAGSASEPVQLGSVVHVLFLRAINTRQDGPNYEEVKETLHRQMMEEAMVRQQQQYLDELRRTALVDKRL